MSGHSKWNNIKRKKEKTDGARAKVFTKIGREISVAVRNGGPDPASNGKLADLISKAKRMNVPNDNIQRIIKKAEGGDKTEYEAINYEGYGPGGVAVMVETLTDNRNRTAADLRHYFDKNGGNLGTLGCVGFMFTQKGVIDISLEDKDADEAMMDALDAGAEDFDAGEDAAEITTDPDSFSAVCNALEAKGYEFISADLAMVPMTTTRLTESRPAQADGQAAGCAGGGRRRAERLAQPGERGRPAGITPGAKKAKQGAGPWLWPGSFCFWKVPWKGDERWTTRTRSFARTAGPSWRRERPAVPTASAVLRGATRPEPCRWAPCWRDGIPWGRC